MLGRKVISLGARGPKVPPKSGMEKESRGKERRSGLTGLCPRGGLIHPDRLATVRRCEGRMLPALRHVTQAQLQVSRNLWSGDSVALGLQSRFPMGDMAPGVFRCRA
ncbi:MAG: hypothetical protein KatS3mg109_0252 [Pirellulaceae bacterium]|nr:MAG: hypothetical protein KatS3mg109_0252 [Pirellulaceae bacterium]